jgi:hypothetical protein
MTIPRIALRRRSSRRSPKHVVAMLVLAFGLVAMNLPRAAADVLWLRDGTTLYGRIEAELPDHILFRERTDRPGEYRSRTVQRNEVDSMVRTIDEERLAALQHGNWPAYRDLAEELEVQQADPEARETALHLYLLLARHAIGDLRERGFRGAIAVADAQQQRLIRALAHQQLADSGVEWPVDGRVLQSRAPVDLTQLNQLQTALREFRDGAPRALQRLAADPATRDLLEPLAATCSWPQFQELAGSGEPDFAALARAIDLEIAIARWLTGDEPGPPRSDSPWSVLVHQARNPLPLPDFESVSPIPLNRTVWRDGGWKELVE